ncbi:MAG: hypothetical protein IJH71_07095 [Eubacterium sp.]|nr:hypothetical protein [Eubacterium sp.]
MKKLAACLMVICMVGSVLCACGSQKAGENTSAMNLQESSTGEKVHEDFTENVNTNRASTYAKTELPLPVEGIGRGITTKVKADKKIQDRSNDQKFHQSLYAWHVGRRKKGRKRPGHRSADTGTLQPGFH